MAGTCCTNGQLTAKIEVVYFEATTVNNGHKARLFATCKAHHGVCAHALCCTKSERSGNTQALFERILTLCEHNYIALLGIFHSHFKFLGRGYFHSAVLCKCIILWYRVPAGTPTLTHLLHVDLGHIHLAIHKALRVNPTAQINLVVTESDTIRAVKDLYDIFFRHNLSMKNAIEKAESEVPQIPEVIEFLDFIKSSKRGILTGNRGSRRA
ncbi:MAG: hypothetical protein IKU97_04110 [Tidjanibacter sp.]|nr:hypothetical protein [Tidjanibacter sp.]